MKHKFLALTIGAITAGAANLSAALLNGSFEEGSAPPDSSLGIGSTAIPGWTVVEGEIAQMNNSSLVSHGYRTPYGNRYLDLGSWNFKKYQ